MQTINIELIRQSCNVAPNSALRNYISLIRGDIMVDVLYKNESRRDVSLNSITKAIIGENAQGKTKMVFILL